MPAGDQVVHEADCECVCGPEQRALTRPSGAVDWLVVHHALDGRDLLTVPQ